MKKRAILAVFLTFWYAGSMAAVRPTVTKSNSAQYSGISGRRYAVARPEPEEVIVVRTVGAATYPDELASAEEKNSSMRLQQLQRASQRAEGSY